MGIWEDDILNIDKNNKYDLDFIFKGGLEKEGISNLNLRGLLEVIIILLVKDIDLK